MVVLQIPYTSHFCKFSFWFISIVVQFIHNHIQLVCSLVSTYSIGVLRAENLSTVCRLERVQSSFFRRLLSSFMLVWCSIFIYQGEVLETVTAALVSFFDAQQAMLDQVPQLGHIPKIFKSMTSRNDAIPMASVSIVHGLANSDVSKFS